MNGRGEERRKDSGDCFSIVTGILVILMLMRVGDERLAHDGKICRIIPNVSMYRHFHIISRPVSYRPVTYYIITLLFDPPEGNHDTKTSHPAVVPVLDHASHAIFP